MIDPSTEARRLLMIAYLVLIISLVGLLIYAFAPAKLQEIGRLMFACGFLAFCFKLASYTVTLFK